MAEVAARAHEKILKNRKKLIYISNLTTIEQNASKTSKKILTKQKIMLHEDYLNKGNVYVIRQAEKSKPDL